MEMRWHVVLIILFNWLVLLAAIAGISFLVVRVVKYLKNERTK